MTIIVPVSGGKASAYCLKWALDNFDKEDILPYFNNTKWEHPDLYRFLKDLEQLFQIKIYEDSDGRTPEQVFYDRKFLSNSRNGNCSIELKAKRLQKFYKDGDTIIFGIDSTEARRASKLQVVYEKVSRQKKKKCELIFPLIKEQITKDEINTWLYDEGVEPPEIYKKGFTHNNCYGGCVKAGKKQWKLLYETYPEVYLDRERVETEWQQIMNKNNTILKNISLKDFREILGKNINPEIQEDDEEENLPADECFGICDLYN